jgi:monovalent cation:H+ antiporter-2, CPA2 family
VEALREQGLHAIAGDATHPETLMEAAIDKADAIIVAIPNPYEAKRIVEATRALKQDIKVLVRAHNDEEFEYFSGQKVDLAVIGVQEVARRMVEYLRYTSGKKKY